jgi:hypothetical protein
MALPGSLGQRLGEIDLTVTKLMAQQPDVPGTKSEAFRHHLCRQSVHERSA